MHKYLFPAEKAEIFAEIRRIRLFISSLRFSAKISADFCGKPNWEAVNWVFKTQPSIHHTPKKYWAVRLVARQYVCPFYD